MTRIGPIGVQARGPYGQAFTHVSLPANPTRTRKGTSRGSTRCRRKFLRYFPAGFRDETYMDWERGYKWDAHQRWQETLGGTEFARLLRRGDHVEAAARAVRIESRTNLLFSFEKMALRDAVRTKAGARIFAQGLYDFLYGRSHPESRFERWCEAIASLPRRQTRVLTWPLVTVFGFLALPKTHIFLKPNVTRIAASAWNFDFDYRSRPNLATWSSLLAFAADVRRGIHDLRPRDMIDIQSFLWVQGSDEYPD